MTAYALQQQRARWYPLIPHPVQLELMGAIDNGVRFPVVPAGRRSGKTERLKRFIAKRAMRGPGDELLFLAAPTFAQVKKIFWADMKKLTFSVMHEKQPSETELILRLPRNVEVHLIGLDKPERFEGIPWDGGGIDEIADIPASAWEENIYPALNTYNPTKPGYRPWSWLTGVPEGLNHFYDMAEYARTGSDPSFKLYHWKSSEILPAEVIADAKRHMSARQYRQEFEASFETATGRIYEDYGPKNYTAQKIAAHEPLYWFHDFNYTPLSSGIGVQRGDKFLCLDEIILTSAVARQSALEFVDKYKNHLNKTVYIYGDPSGRAGEKHAQASNYTDIEAVLRDYGWRFERRVKPAAPAIRDRQNAVRAQIMNAAGEVSLFVNPTAAPYTHKGLATVQLKKGSSFIEEETDYQHITTAVGYMIEYEKPQVEWLGQIQTRVA